MVIIDEKSKSMILTHNKRNNKLKLEVPIDRTCVMRISCAHRVTVSILINIVYSEYTAHSIQRKCIMYRV